MKKYSVILFGDIVFESNDWLLCYAWINYTVNNYWKENMKIIPNYTTII